MKLSKKHKNTIKRWIPAAIQDWLAAVTSNKITFIGQYDSWESAVQRSSGYSDEEILAKVKSALLEVKNGNAAYERDSVLFYDDQKPFALLTCLLRIVRNSSQLNVLDIGGSLGSTYFQCRDFLDHIDNLNWIINEQEHFVQCGRESFEDEVLSFTTDLDSALKRSNPDIVLLSSVLQYLENPYHIIDKIMGSDVEHIILDRTPFSPDDKELLTVQSVPSSIYNASYPSWIFSRSRLVGHISNRYSMELEFDASDGRIESNRITACYKGFLFRKCNA